MSQEQAKQLILQGVEAAKSGNKDQAREIFQNAIRLDPQSETAWLWLSSVARDNRERLFCFQNLLQINPQNEMAIKGVQALGLDPRQVLQQLQQQQAQSQATRGTRPPSGEVPTIAPERLSSAMESVDRILREYRPIPAEGTGAEYDAKEKQRYGEAIALRKRNTRLALAGTATTLVLALIIGLIAVALSSGSETIASVSQRATPTASLTPSNTPTATPGVTNTPSPEAQVSETPFEPPPGLDRGSRFGNPPTEVYPQLVNRDRNVEEAIALYSIRDYEAAVPTLEVEHATAVAGANNANTCPADTTLYTAIALADLGGRRNLDDAEAIAEEASRREACDQSPLVYTANCYVDYRQFEETGDFGELSRTGGAEGWCDAAINDSQGLVPILAYTTQAKILNVQSRFNDAAAVLDNALERFPSDMNLLLTRAEVELNRGNLARSLDYISRALYVEPISEPALRLRVQAYLDTAAEASNLQRRTQLYGTAVIWSQEYLIFYPGEPAAYVLLARARLGEGNVNLALDALNRVIENSIPNANPSVIADAYTLRSQIYFQLARYEEALRDIERLLQNNPDDLILIEQQANIAFLLEQYPLALEGYDQILEATPERTDILLKKLEMRSELCLFTDTVDCDFEFVLDTIDEGFLADLEPELQPIWQANRAIALYETTLAAPEDELTLSQRQTNYQLAQADMEAALAVDETALNHYYRGLILEQLGDEDEALRDYQWVVVWSNFYDYPFIEDVQARIDEIQGEDE